MSYIVVSYIKDGWYKQHEKLQTYVDKYPFKYLVTDTLFIDGTFKIPLEYIMHSNYFIEIEDEIRQVINFVKRYKVNNGVDSYVNMNLDSESKLLLTNHLNSVFQYELKKKVGEYLSGQHILNYDVNQSLMEYNYLTTAYVKTVSLGYLGESIFFNYSLNIINISLNLYIEGVDLYYLKNMGWNSIPNSLLLSNPLNLIFN